MQVTAAGNGYSPVELGIPAQIKPDIRVFENVKPVIPQARSEPPPDIMKDLETITIAFNKKLKFEVNHQSNEVTVKVIDPETDKVIKVLPPKELQRLHSKLKETIGFLFDERI
jgi:uncharacterized FlaG/YvyC family protein